MNKKILNEINEMKYLFGYKRGVVMSEQRIINESTEMIEKGKSMFNSLSEPEKMKLGKAIKECLKEHHQGTIAGIGLAAAIVGIGGVYLMVKTFGVDIASLVSGAIVFGFVKMEVDEIKKIIDCVKEKMNEVEPETTEPEMMEEQLATAAGKVASDIKEKVKISLIGTDGTETVLWDGTKVVDKDAVQRILHREMNMKDVTGDLDENKLHLLLVYVNARIREGGGTEFGEKYKVSKA